MPDTKISQLTSATTPLAGTEVLPIVQSGATVKVANNDLRPKQIQSNATTGVLQIAGPSAGTTRTMTTPDANFTVARVDASNVFTGPQAFNIVTSNNNDTANKSQQILYENTNGGIVIASGFSSSFYSYSNSGTSGNVAYLSNGGSFLQIATGIVAIVGSTFTIGANTYTVTSSTPNGYVYVTPSASGEAATGTLTGLEYATERFRIDSSGNQTLYAGNLVFGTSGKGIDFSATSDPASGMTSELLADYEEGTWTPAYAFSTSGSATAAVAVGRYTKIGRQVTANFLIYTSSISSPTGNATVSGLPYAAANVTNSMNAGSLAEVRRFATDLPNLRIMVRPNTAVVTIYKQATNAVNATALDGATDFSASTNYNFLSGSVTYFV